MKPSLFPFGLFLIASFVQQFAHAQGIYEVRHEIMNASGWFGGDNRPGNTRSVGVAQSVQIDTPVTLNSFSFYFTNRFDYALNPDGFGHEVTLKLTVRDSLGNAVESYNTVVPASFEGGWVEWAGLNLIIPSPAQVIFSAYLIGATTTHEYWTGQSSDLNAGYSGGFRYVKEDNNDAAMDDWTDWIQHSWDSAFRLAGTTLTVGVNEHQSAPITFALNQNYPNPFNPTTNIGFRIKDSGYLTLRVYDVLGREVATLVEGEVEAGSHTVSFDASAFTDGVYFYKIQAGQFAETRKMILLR